MKGSNEKYTALHALTPILMLPMHESNLKVPPKVKFSSLPRNPNRPPFLILANRYAQPAQYHSLLKQKPGNAVSMMRTPRFHPSRLRHRNPFATAAAAATVVDSVPVLI